MVGRRLLVARMVADARRRRHRPSSHVPPVRTAAVGVDGSASAIPGSTPTIVRPSRIRPGVSVGPDRNLALELVRVTEAAALGAARWIGRGDKNAADQAAVDAMRLMLDTVAMDGDVVIGEGEKDEAPMLYNGEH